MAAQEGVIEPTSANEADPGLDLQVRVRVNTGEAVVAVGARTEQGRGSSPATSSTQPHASRAWRR
jgi:class 3 adenylate cyclase